MQPSAAEREKDENEAKKVAYNLKVLEHNYKIDKHNMDLQLAHDAGWAQKLARNAQSLWSTGQTYKYDTTSYGQRMPPWNDNMGSYTRQKQSAKLAEQINKVRTSSSLYACACPDASIKMNYVPEYKCSGRQDGLTESECVGFHFNAGARGLAYIGGGLAMVAYNGEQYPKFGSPRWTLAQLTAQQSGVSVVAFELKFEIDIFGLIKGDIIRFNINFGRAGCDPTRAPTCYMKVGGDFP